MKKEKTQTINTKRLLRLAKHLRTGNLGHKKFYFGQWNTDQNLSQLEENGCGFAGCAIGECPFVFKSHWRFKDGYPVLRGSVAKFPHLRSKHTLQNAETFFGISNREALHLFIPGCENSLSCESTKLQVANNIEEFVKANS